MNKELIFSMCNFTKIVIFLLNKQKMVDFIIVVLYNAYDKYSLGGN